jgi:hypothetical protein
LVKQVVGQSASGAHTHVKGDANLPGDADPDFEPPWYFIPDSPDFGYKVEGSVPLDTMPPGTVFQGNDGQAYTLVATTANSATYVGPNGTHTATGAAELSDQFGIIPSLSTEPVGKSFATKAQSDFFDHLKTGDKLLFKGKPATVVDNTIPGTGILVKTDDAPPEFVGNLAREGDVHAPEPPVGATATPKGQGTSPMGALPVGSVVKFGDDEYIKTGDLGGGTYSVVPAPWSSGALNHLYNSQVEVVSTPVAGAGMPMGTPLDTSNFKDVEVGSIITSATNYKTPYVVTESGPGYLKFKVAKSFEDNTPSENAIPEFNTENYDGVQFLFMGAPPAKKGGPITGALSAKMVPNTNQKFSVFDLPAGSYYQPYDDDPTNIVNVVGWPSPNEVTLRTVGESADQQVTVPADHVSAPARVLVAPGEHQIPVTMAHLNPGDVFVNESGDDPATLGWVLVTNDGEHTNAIATDSPSNASAPTSAQAWKIVGFEPTPQMAAFWKTGDPVFSPYSDGAQDGYSVVVSPMNSAGEMEFQHVAPGKSWDGEKYKLYAAAILQTYQMHKLTPDEVAAYGHPAPPPEPSVATKDVHIDHVSQLKVGDTYKVEDYGLTWKVVATSGESADVELVRLASGNPKKKSLAELGKKSHISGPINVLVARPVSTDEPADSPLEPYLHPKSGKYHYPKLGSLKPGSEFTDKKHGKFALIGFQGSMAVFEDIKGNQFTASKDVRVKLVSPPPLSEARMAMSTSGRYLITA